MNLVSSGQPPEHGHDGEGGDKHKWDHKELPFCHIQHHLGLSYEGEMSHNTIKSPREGDKEGNQLFGECRQAMGSWAGWGAAEPQGSGLSQGCLCPMSCHWPWRGSQIIVSYVMPFAPCFYLKIRIILRQVDLYRCYHPAGWGKQQWESLRTN